MSQVGSGWVAIAATTMAPFPADITKHFGDSSQKGIECRVSMVGVGP